MSEMYVTGLPGVRTARTASHRVVFKQRSEFFLAGGKLIAGACSRDTGNTGDLDILRPGLVMGKISSVVNSLGTVGLYAPSFLGVTTNAEAVGSTSVQAAAAVVTELVRRCGSSGSITLFGPATANGLMQSEVVAYSAASSTNITTSALVNAYVAGSFICGTDGSEYPETFIPDGWGIQATDVDHTTNLDVEFPLLPVSGIVDASQLINWPSDTTLQQWLIGRLSKAGAGRFTFDVNY